jgi:hypothetical protein
VGERATVSIWLGQGDGRFVAASEVEVGPFPSFVVVGDFTGDGRLDLAVAHGLPAIVSIWLGQGDGRFVAGPVESGFCCFLSGAVGDFNGDGHLDLAVVERTLGADALIRLGQGDGRFVAAPEVEVGPFPVSVAAGGFNGDGHQDLATANQDGQSVSIRLGQSDGRFVATPEVRVGMGEGEFPDFVVVGDFTGDGRLDLATVNGDPETISIRLGQGNGRFVAAPEVEVGTRPFSVAVGDFTGDGRLDLAVEHVSADADTITVSIWLGQGDGRFVAGPDVGDVLTLSIASIAVGDFNSDGLDDLAVTDGADTVSILLNTTAVGINALVTFVPLHDTFRFTPEPTGCPAPFIGTFRFEARLTNISAHVLAALVAQVADLSPGTLLQNADGGPGGVGAQLTVPLQEDFTDGRLSPEEFVDVPFTICLQERSPFEFFVDVLGDVDTSECTHSAVEQPDGVRAIGRPQDCPVLGTQVRAGGVRGN